MRKHFSNYLEQIAGKRDDLVFVTGDLGYSALEKLASMMGDRFINAGVAEQNMIGVAAGMASQGYQVICYSIAPFVVYRCLEQIRNDVCFHNLPVYVVGNGGGYGYGIMGSSHHAIEDIATLSGLPNMNCYVPAFIEDMQACLDEMFICKKPTYLRLGPGKNISLDLLLNGFGTATKENLNAELTIIAQGPVANNVMTAWDANSNKNKTDVFTINKMPFTSLPEPIRASIIKTKKVLVVEEHIAIGGIGSAVSFAINEQSLLLNKFISLHAKGYPNGLYGNQNYHYQMSGLDADAISGNRLVLLIFIIAGFLN